MCVKLQKINVGTSPAIELNVFAEFKLCFKPSPAMWVKIQPGFAFKHTNIEFSCQMAGNPVQLNRCKADVHKPAVVKPAIYDCQSSIRFRHPIELVNGCFLFGFWNMVERVLTQHSITYIIFKRNIGDVATNEYGRLMGVVIPGLDKCVNRNINANSYFVVGR